MPGRMRSRPFLRRNKTLKIQKKGLLFFLLLLLLIPWSGLGAGMMDQFAEILSPPAPWEAEVSLRLDALVPFDENRLEALNRLLGHLSLKLFAGEGASAVSVRMDGKDVLGLTEYPEQEPPALTFSFDPEVRYTGASLSDLTGISSEEEALRSVSAKVLTADGRTAWPEEGFALLESLPELFPEYTKTTETKTKLKDVGTSQRKAVITLTKDAVQEGVMSRLTGAETGESLHAFLAGLVFSGRQQFTLYLDEDGRLLKANYSGQCGPEGDLRKVSLEWRGLRSDFSLDEITLKAPAVKGSDKDVLILTRTEKNAAQGGEEGASLQLDLELTSVRNRVKSVLKAAAELQLKDRLTGSVTLSTGDGKTFESLVLGPDLCLQGADGWDGTLRLQHLVQKETKADLAFSISLTPASGDPSGTAERTVDVSALPEAERESLRQRIRERTASALLRAALLLPQEDLLFLNNELDGEVWQSVLDLLTPVPEGGSD